jgi:FixJ family two-component response regulator
VLEEDGHVRQSWELLIRSQGWRPQTCGSVGEFLARPRPFVPSCLILAFSSMDLNGLEIQKQIAKKFAEMPIIVVADYGDVSTTVQAMKAGAIDFLTEPYSDDSLVTAIRNAIERSKLLVRRSTELQAVKSRYARLTSREREVFALVVAGLPNKQVGSDLGISEITVKAHRGVVMRKMEADSLADLVIMAARLRLPRPNTPSSHTKVLTTPSSNGSASTLLA